MAKDKQEESLRKDAATKIQSHFKGFIARKKYTFKQLPNEAMVGSNVLVDGNDPKIIGLAGEFTKDKAAIIATSGMRSIEIACKLSGSPKLIIIDNSREVVRFWRTARKLINISTSKEHFVKALIADIVKGHYADGSIDSMIKFINFLFEQHGENKVKKVIGGVTVLAQSWVNKDILIKIKNILALNGITKIYAYPSNIVSYLNIEEENTQDAQQVLHNIARLNPELAIHTDLIEQVPKNVLLVRQHNPDEIFSKLQLHPLKGRHKNETSIEAGDIVTFKGITNNNDKWLNGRTAAIKSFETKTGRFIASLMLEVGDPVVIHNLNSDAGKLLNGQLGKIVSMEKDRYTIRFSKMGDCKKLIKPENVMFFISIAPVNVTLAASSSFECKGP